MSSIRIYENKTFKLNNLLKYELHSADENVKALHRVGTVCRRECALAILLTEEILIKITE